MSGQKAHLQITYPTLNKIERSKIKLGLYVVPVFAILIAGLIAFMASLSNGSVWFIVLLVLGFEGYMVYLIRCIRRDLKDNEKKVTSALLTDKKIIRRYKSYDTYIWYFGKKRRHVWQHQYYVARKGDQVEIHEAKRVPNMVFEIKVTKAEAPSDPFFDY
ncbi:hypothetical protein [Reichenbachiella sp.]|uniref:hypothetical protein n=1 Tax=Reichenbachiella sp. TaxID=2184521 RepID=UPI003B5CA7CB